MLLTLEDSHPLYPRKRRMARASGQKVRREHHRPRSFYFSSHSYVKLSADSESPFEAKNLYVNLSLKLLRNAPQYCWHWLIE